MSKKLVTIDIELTSGQFDADASYRIPDEMLAWLRQLEVEHKIIGFAYDGTYNFMALLKNTGAQTVPKAVRVREGVNPLKNL